mgnify:CR=1 FL=1
MARIPATLALIPGQKTVDVLVGTHALVQEAVEKGRSRIEWHYRSSTGRVTWARWKKSVSEW